MEFLESMRRYFEHQDCESQDIDKWVDEVSTTINLLPLTLRERVITELNSWERDDFVDIGGYLEALQTVATWWHEVGQHIKR